MANWYSFRAGDGSVCVCVDVYLIYDKSPVIVLALSHGGAERFVCVGVSDEATWAHIGRRS